MKSRTTSTVLSFQSCCRLSTLAEGNADNSWQVRSNILLTDGGKRRTGSPRTSGLPREYLELNMAASFTIPKFVSDGFQPNFAMASGSLSLLSKVSPAGMTNNFVAGGSDLFWTPRSLGLFALQVTISENGGSLYCPYDFIIEVIPLCSPTDTKCNKSPHFSPKTWQEFVVAPKSKGGCECCAAFAANGACVTQCDYCPFYRSYESSFTITACDYDQSDTVVVTPGSLPPTSSWVQTLATHQMLDPFEPTWTKNKACVSYLFTWAPVIDSAAFSAIFQASDNRGKSSVNRYAFLLNIVEADFIYVSGVIRDFSHGQAGGTFGYPPAGCINCNYDYPVTNQVSWDATNRKISLLKLGTSINSKANFDLWFSADHPSAATTVFSTQLIKLPGETVFTFASTFLPINNRLLNNNVYSGQTGNNPINPNDPKMTLE